MDKKLTEREKELNAKSKAIFFKVLDDLGFIQHDSDGEPGIKFEGSLNDMRDGAICVAAISVRLHEILFPIALSTYEDSADDLSKMAALQKRYLERVQYNYEKFMDNVMDDTEMFRKDEKKESDG